MQPSSNILNKWTGSAPFWEKHRSVIRHMFAPVSLALADEARVAPGNSVLDVATGPGEPALSLAAIVGPQGRVCGVDPIPGMVEAARRAADQQGFGNAQFEVAFADALPYPDAAFDAVVSRFGVMFFPSPVDGVREMWRVLRPGRKLALAVWCSPERNPFFSALSRVIGTYADSPPSDSDAPDAFRFAHDGKLRNMLVEAGIPNPAVRLLQFTIEAPLAVAEFLQVRVQMSEHLRETFAAFSSEERARVTSESLESLAEYYTGAGMSFPAEVLIVSATHE